MFTALFEVIIVIVMIRAFRDSKKNKQRKQISSPKPPVPNKPASGKQETGWTPTPKKPKTVVPNQPNPEKKARQGCLQLHGAGQALSAACAQW